MRDEIGSRAFQLQAEIVRVDLLDEAFEHTAKTGKWTIVYRSGGEAIVLTGMSQEEAQAWMPLLGDGVPLRGCGRPRR